MTNKIAEFFGFKSLDRTATDHRVAAHTLISVIRQHKEIPLKPKHVHAGD